MGLQNNKGYNKKTPILIVIIFLTGLGITFGQCETENRKDITICDDLEESCFTLMDRNLGAQTDNISDPKSRGCTYQRGNNKGFPIGCQDNGCDDDTTKTATTTLAVRNNKYNDIGYTDGANFIIKNEDYRSDKSHDGLWGGIDDGDKNGRGTILSKNDDVYDVDIFRQGPCPEGYHVPSLGERKDLINIINKKVTELNFPEVSTYRTYIDGLIKIGEGPNFWTSSPVAKSTLAKAITEQGDEIDVERAMGLHVRCFKNKRDAMVGIGTGTSDIVFFDTQVPSIEKVQGDNIVLLNYTGNSAVFKQQIKITESIKTGKDMSYLFLQACKDLKESFLRLDGLTTELEINCIIDYNMFKPWSQNVLNVYVIGVAGSNITEINNCSMLSSTDAGNTIHLNIEQNFVQDFSVNKSVYTDITSDFIYAPTRNKDGSVLWNYIFTGHHAIQNNIDGDNFMVNDEDLLHGRDVYLLSAEPLGENDINCSIIAGPEGLELNPICKVTKTNMKDTISMGTIYSCGSIGCEDPTCQEGNKCRWNNINQYKKIKAPLKYINQLHISATTGNTYYLHSGDARTIRISLKNNRGCYNRQDGTNSTYIQIKFKKILSPYKAGYLSGDDGGVRYTTKNLGNALKSGDKDIGFQRYITNQQTAKSGEYSGGNIDKINYEIKFNAPIADENYLVEGESTIGSYNKQIIIIKPTFYQENPDSYKFTFPTY